jgi:hypothetical protein
VTSVRWSVMMAFVIIIHGVDVIDALIINDRSSVGIAIIVTLFFIKGVSFCHSLLVQLEMMR